MAMRFSWDSEEDAVEFFEAYLELAKEKSEGLWNLTVIDEKKRMWLGEDISVYLGLGREETLVVIGPDGVTVEAAVSEFPSLP